MGVRIGGQIERVNGKSLQYKEFAERYLGRNQPVLLTGLTEGWTACGDWVAEDGRPNLDFFAAHFGSSRVQVADCSSKEFTDQKRNEMSVSEFIGYWHGLSSGNCGNNSSQGVGPQPLLYLKDWHFAKEYSGYLAYRTPPFFIDDWLNLYLDSYSMHQDSYMQHGKNVINCSDYRFVYMGPKGTWTPLHADVFRSYSWSANVCGRKHWYLLPPSQCHLLFDRNQKNSVYDISDEVSEKHFQDLHRLFGMNVLKKRAKSFLYQVDGFIKFIICYPAFKEDTISINHNWFNGYNLSFVWNLLVKDYSEAKDYIEDIRDICDNFEWLCQRNLAANTGMNFYDFFMFILRFTLASFFLLFHLKREESSRFYSSNKVKQLIHNLVAIHNVAKSMKSADAFTEENLRNFSGEDWYALTDISRIMGEHRFHEFTMAIDKAYALTDEPEEKDLNLSSMSLNASVCSSPSYFEKLNFLQAPELKICCPSDLVRLIEHFFKDTDGIFIGLDVNLFQELHCQIPSSTRGSY